MSEYWMYLAIGAVLFLVVIVAYVYQQGMFGTMSVPRIKKKLEWHSLEMTRLEQELTDKQAEDEAKAKAAEIKEAEKGVPTLTRVINRTDSIAAAHDLFTKGAISREHYEKLRDDIMGPA